MRRKRDIGRRCSQMIAVLCVAFGCASNPVAVRTESTSSTAPVESSMSVALQTPSTQPISTAVPGVVRPTNPPSSWLSVSADGRVAIHLTDGGLATTQLGELPDATGAWTVPDSNTIYVAYCCEPVGGNGYRVNEEIALEDRVSAFAGYSAVPDPTGQWVAVPQQIGLYVQAESADEPSRHVSDTPADREATIAWLQDSRIAWLPDPTANPPVVEIIDLRDGDRISSIQLPELWNPTIAAGPAGTIFFTGCQVEPLDGELCEQSFLGSLDITSEEASLLADLEPGARLGGSDPTGSILIYVDDMQWAWWWSTDGSEFLGEGIIAASWIPE